MAIACSTRDRRRAWGEKGAWAGCRGCGVERGGGAAAWLAGVTAIACGTEADKMVSGGFDGSVRVWRVTAESRVMLGSMKEHKATVNCIRVSHPPPPHTPQHTPPLTRPHQDARRSNVQREGTSPAALLAGPGRSGPACWAAACWTGSVLACLQLARPGRVGATGQAGPGRCGAGVLELGDRLGRVGPARACWS